MSSKPPSSPPSLAARLRQAWADLEAWLEPPLGQQPEQQHDRPIAPDAALRPATDRPALSGVLDQRPFWSREGLDWPNRAASRFVDAAGLTWHVQVTRPPAARGTAPVLLLLHGTGAATHSWAGLLPLLQDHFTLVAPDLPGHGFTGAPPPQHLNLPDMAAAVAALLARLDLAPSIGVGHSAGAAILARMALDGAIAPRVLVSLNGVLLPLGRMRASWFAPATKRLARGAAVPRLVASRARRDPASVARLAASTGSRLKPQQVEWYRRLVGCPGHVSAALNMMANWDLVPLQQALPELAAELVLIGCSEDHTVSCAEAARVHAMLPRSRLLTLGGLGHLAHEEEPAAVAAHIIDAAQRAGLLT